MWQMTQKSLKRPSRGKTGLFLAVEDNVSQYLSGFERTWPQKIAAKWPKNAFWAQKSGFWVVSLAKFGVSLAKNPYLWTPARCLYRFWVKWFQIILGASLCYFGLKKNKKIKKKKFPLSFLSSSSLLFCSLSLPFFSCYLRLRMRFPSAEKVLN